MALGKNLTKKQLIPAGEKTTVTQKNTPQPVKKTVKKAVSKKVETKEIESTQSLEKAGSKTPELNQTNQVSQEFLKARRELRLRFNQEIKSLSGREIHLIIFHLGKEEYGVNINNTKEVVLTPEIMKVPGLPRYAPGVINIRGTIFTLIDLYEKFNLEAKGIEKPYTLILKNTQLKAGIMVNEVPLTLKTNGDFINGIDEVITDLSIDESYIKGIVNLNGRMIFYLDVNELVKGERDKLMTAITKY